MVAAITTPFKPDIPPRDFGEVAPICGVTALLPEFSSMAWRARHRPSPDRGWPSGVDAVLKRRVVQVGDARSMAS